jgi:hypothetical protein
MNLEVRIRMKKEGEGEGRFPPRFKPDGHGVQNEGVSLGVSEFWSFWSREGMVIEGDDP